MPQQPRRERAINAPLIVILTAGVLVLLYAAFSFLGYATQEGLLYDFALAPERFWASPDSGRGYPNLLAGLFTLVSTAFLHGDWGHVLVNAAMLLSFGTPVARAVGGGLGGALRWFVVFFGAVVAGSATYLALHPTVHAPPAIGASGGTSGLMAAGILADPGGGLRSPFSRDFVGFTLAFAVINVVLVLAGPAMFGALVSWEAHAGGYVAGALLMALVARRREAASE